MKKLALTLGVASLIPVASFASEPEFYGKVNVSWQNVEEDEESYTEVVSNASRLGVKGEVVLEEGLTAIYKVEVELDVDGDDDDLFKQRNTFVGVKGEFGQVITGYFDTPLKKAQKKVDLFNDLEGDIKSVITRSDNRGRNSIQYSTPSFSGMKVAVDVINSEEDGVDNGYSASFTYSNETFYVAGGYDQNVEGEDIEVMRAVGQFYAGDLTFGVLIESDKDDAEDKTDRAQLISLSYKLSDSWVLKAQTGMSDIRFEDASTTSIGADYKISKSAKFFGYITSEVYDVMVASGSDEVENQYIGAGIELKF